MVKLCFLGHEVRQGELVGRRMNLCAYAGWYNCNYYLGKLSSIRSDLLYHKSQESFHRNKIRMSTFLGQQLGVSILFQCL